MGEIYRSLLESSSLVSHEAGLLLLCVEELTILEEFSILVLSNLIVA
jgi:hypothetical protein